MQKRANQNIRPNKRKWPANESDAIVAKVTQAQELGGLIGRALLAHRGPQNRKPPNPAAIVSDSRNVRYPGTLLLDLRLPAVRISDDDPRRHIHRRHAGGRTVQLLG